MLLLSPYSTAVAVIIRDAPICVVYPRRRQESTLPALPACLPACLPTCLTAAVLLLESDCDCLVRRKTCILMPTASHALPLQEKCYKTLQVDTIGQDVDFLIVHIFAQKVYHLILSTRT